MIGRSKRLVCKELRTTTTHQYTSSTIHIYHTMTRCGYAIVERIAMTKRKASDLQEGRPKRINASTDFVYSQPALHPKIRKVSGTKIGKRQIYRFFINCNGKYFPLRCILDLGSTSFVISPEAVKASGIRVRKRSKQIK